jgi:hypothetical protein
VTSAPSSVTSCSMSSDCDDRQSEDQTLVRGRAEGVRAASGGGQVVPAATTRSMASISGHDEVPLDGGHLGDRSA